MKTPMIILTVLLLNVCYCSSQENIDNLYNMEIDTVSDFDNRAIAEIYFSGILDSLHCDCNNGIATKKFLQKVRLLSKYIDGNDGLINWVWNAIMTLELVTGIESESDGNYFGKLKPTKSDIIKWQYWFIENYNRLCWNDKKNILYLKPH